MSTNQTDEMLQEEANPTYRPNKRQRTIRRKVWTRYRDMADNQWRKEAEKDWDIADKMFRQYMPDRDPDDWRSDIMLPDGFAAVQAQMQETIDRNSRPVLERVEDSDEARTELANAILGYNMDKTGFDFQYFKAKYAAAVRGTAFLMNTYRVDKREVNDPVGVNPDGTLKYKKKEVIDFDDDYTEFIENEYIYVDEAGGHIDEKRDMVRREIIHIDEFRRIYSKKPDFFDTDKVMRGGDTNTRQFFRLEHDMHSDDVEVLHYYNRATDEYLVIANNVTIRDGFIPFKHKELPIAVVYHYMIPGFFWGMGIPKVIWALTEERRSLRNLNLDRQKLQINQMFVVSDSASLDEEELYTRPGGMIEVNTGANALNQTIMPLQYGDVPASYFKTEEILLEDIRRAHGIDDRIQGVQAGGTATEAAILKESSQKRINLLARLVEMDTMIRVGRLKWSNIQFFYPAPRVEKIIEDNDEREKKVYKKIKVKGKQFDIVKGDDGKTELKFSEINGDSSFKLDSSMARFMEGDYDVTISSEAHSVLSKPIQQAKVTEMFTLLLSNPNIASVLDPKKAVFRYLEINDENPKDWMRGSGVSVEDMRALAEAENSVMAQGVPLPGTEDADEEHTLVHINFTQTADYEKLPPVVQQIFKNHILQEHDSNPATGSAADLLGGAQGGSAGAAGAPMPNGAPDSGMNSLQSVDVQPQSPISNQPTGP